MICIFVLFFLPPFFFRPFARHTNHHNACTGETYIFVLCYFSLQISKKEKKNHLHLMSLSSSLYAIDTPPLVCEVLSDAIVGSSEAKKHRDTWQGVRQGFNDLCARFISGESDIQPLREATVRQKNDRMMWLTMIGAFGQTARRVAEGLFSTAPDGCGDYDQCHFCKARINGEEKVANGLFRAHRSCAVDYCVRLLPTPWAEDCLLCPCGCGEYIVSQ